MQGRHQHQPRYVHRVLNGVPVPVAPKVERFVSPVAAHHDADAQDTRAEQGPGLRRPNPGQRLVAPQSGNAVRERHQRQGKAQKQGRRVNHHPVVLKQRVEAVTIFGHERRVGRKDGRVGHGFGQQQERRRTQFERIAEDDAQDHRRQKRLH